jgi:ribosome-associated translation inhibitor RaiA
VEVRGNDITADQSAATPMEALDLLVEKVEQRLRRRKTAKLARRTRVVKPLEPAVV